MVDHLHGLRPDIGIACLYADYTDQHNQTLAHILGSFLHQLLTTNREPISGEVIEKLQNIQYMRGKVGTEDILAMLKLRLHQLKCAFICIDGIDELGSRVRQQLLNALKELSTNNNMRLFLTGRGHVESVVRRHFQVAKRYTVEISANEQDIREFVRQRINDDPNPEAIDKVLAKDIEDVLIEKSQGM